MIEPDAVLAAHLPVDAEREPQRADQVHLDGEGVEKRRPLEVVVGARRALDPLHQFGDVFDGGRRHGAAGVVDQDVDAPVGVDHFRDHRIDGAEIALVADHLGAALQPGVVLVRAGKGVELRPGAADDGGACAKQFVCDSDADPAAGARDDGHLALEDALAVHPPNHRRAIRGVIGYPVSTLVHSR